MPRERSIRRITGGVKALLRGAVAEGETNADAQLDAASPGAPELLRATLEKIVFFEWRVRELSSELSAAQARAQAAELERAAADEAARAAAAQAQAATMRAAELEAERSRLAELVSRPAQLAAPARDEAELAALRERSARLAEALEVARLQIARQKDERARWLNEMIAQARSGDEAPAALAQFISELRGEVIALRQRQQESDALLARAGIEPPKAAGEVAPAPPAAEPVERTRGAVEAARALWDEGRLGGLNAALEQAAAAAAAVERPAPGQAGPTGATRALAEQCLRGLAAADPARRAQAARHLAALPVKAAAPALAAALAREEQPQAKAALARALVACGEEAAQRIVQGLLDPREPPLVRLAALEALSSSGEAALAALEAAARDPEPALRRRAAALALERGGCEPLVARLSADREASVRAAARGVEGSPSATPAQELAPFARSSAVATPRAASAEPSSGPASRSAVAEDARQPPAAAAGFSAPRGPEAEGEIPPARSAFPAEARREALHAVRAAMFGLTEAELGDAVGLQGDDAARFARALVEEGLLSRRGRKLVVGEAAPQQEQGGAAR